MGGKIFISQAALSTWVSSELVDLQGDTLTFRNGGGSVSLVPASLFKSLSGGDDRQALVGRVKDEAAVAALGAEAYMTSVLLGETAYDIEPGFLALPLSDTPEDNQALLEALRDTAGP